MREIGKRIVGIEQEINEVIEKIGGANLELTRTPMIGTIRLEQRQTISAQTSVGEEVGQERAAEDVGVVEMMIVIEAVVTETAM